MADAADVAVPNANPPAAPPAFTPAQVELAQQLRENATAWLQEQAEHELTKNERHGALEMAYSILLTEDMGPKDALEAAVDQILTRRRLTEQMGVNLCPSSPATSRIGQPIKKGKRKRTANGKKEKKHSRKAKKKGKARQAAEGSEVIVSESGSSSSSSSSSDSDGASSSSDESDSDSDDSASSASASVSGWQRGKTNPEEWDALRVPLHISKKVQKGDFVDLWWFTPTTCRERHDDSPVSLSISGNTIKRVAKDKPKNFLEDWELSQSDFHWAMDVWLATMRDENVDEDTVQAWNSFNTDVRTYKKRDDPVVQIALQQLHHFQRDSFANTTRRVKNMIKAIEKSGSSSKKKAKALSKLRRFDPAKFPKKQLEGMVSQQRADAIKRLQAALSASASQHPPQHHPMQSVAGGGQPRQPKPFRNKPGASSSQPKVTKACALCGSKQPYDVRRCRAQRLASNLQPTFALRDENSDLVTRNGRKAICIGWSTSGCRGECHRANVCSLCGSSSCSAQKCGLVTTAAPPSSAYPQA
ncbi:unnamed protein product [Tilletia laevis]|uniref:Uncharacterized protein n=1 Tax=Tilletia laevis TaxID=157183 RepID=A0A9N8LSZ1_9BASI|nr:unnamed protein product [Tilletia laevis]CAD6938409.1 unnamed protein product [Tilletia laevis]CAD7061510.1 unnamed protein product [Tilletia caries]